MAKVYTARDMRQKAFALELIGHDEAAAMLRQAADLMEREERYEYGALWNGLAISNRTESIESAKKAVEVINSQMLSPIAKLVRRPIGEWEEVKE